MATYRDFATVAQGSASRDNVGCFWYIGRLPLCYLTLVLIRVPINLHLLGLPVYPWLLQLPQVMLLYVLQRSH